MTSVSVVVPTKDRPDRLGRALRSVERQTVGPAEVVVVSAGDHEAAARVVDAVDLPVTHVHQRGRGLSQARNQGVAASEGDLVAFLDDDDRWAAGKLEAQLRAVTDSDRAFVFTGVRHVSPAGDTIDVHRPDGSPDGEDILTRNRIGTPSSVLVGRSSLAAVGGFDEALGSREEWDLYIRLLEHCDCTCVPDPLVIKEFHPDAMSRDVDLVRAGWTALFEKHEARYGPGAERRFFANYHFELGRMYAKRGDLREARVAYRQSLARRFRPTRLGHLLATFSGEGGYRRLTGVYRAMRSLRKRIAPSSGS